MSRFLSDENYHLQIYANSVGDSIRRFKVNGMPEFGHLSLMPIMPRVFDNPKLAQILGTTACVINETGEIYINANFLAKIAKEDLETSDSPKPTTNSRFVFLHELSHQYLSHIHQGSNLLELGLSHDSLNKGADTAINGMLTRYDTLHLGEVFKSIFDEEELIVIKGYYGTTEAEFETFKRASYVEIAVHYHMAEQKEKQRQQKKGNEQGQGQGQGQQQKQDGNDPQQGQGQGQGQGQQQKQDGNDPQQGQGQGQGQQQKQDGSDPQQGQGQGQQQKQDGSDPQQGQGKGKGDSKDETKKDDKTMSDGGDFGLDHTKSLKDIVDALNESGLGHVAEHFGYPKEVTDQISKEMTAKQGESIERINSIMSDIASQSSISKDPASDFFSREYKSTKPRPIGFENLSNVLADSFGGGFSYTDAEPGIEIMFDASHYQEHYGVDALAYTGIYAPLTEQQELLIVLDTSGSMTAQGRIEGALSAIVGIVEANDQISGVHLCYADDVARKIVYFSRDEVTAMPEFSISGFGGTNMASALTTGVVLARQDSASVKAVVLIHDGDDYTLASRMPEVHEAVLEVTGDVLPPLIVIIPPGCGAAHFTQSMEDYAVVLQMDSNTNLIADYEIAANRGMNHSNNFKP